MAASSSRCFPDTLPTRSREVPTLAGCVLTAIAAHVLPRWGDEADEELQLLRSVSGSILPAYPDWQDACAACLDQPRAEDLPLIDLSVSLSLRSIDLLVAALASAVEGDVLVGRTLARIQAPLGGSRPTIGLLAAVLAPLAPSGCAAEDLVSGPAFDCGLLELRNIESPLSERTVAMPLAIHLALRNRDYAWQGATLGLGDTPAPPLSPSLEDGVASHAACLEEGGGLTLVIRSASPAEARSVCVGIAARLRRRVLFLEGPPSPGLGPWLQLRRAIPAFCCDLAPGERKVLPDLPGYSGPRLAVCGVDGTVEPRGEPALQWLLSTPPAAERRALWQLALGDAGLGDQLAASHRHGCGRIAQLGRLARRRAVLHGRSRPALEDVVDAAWTSEGPGLETLAQPLRASVPDEALITSERLRSELLLLELRCRYRETLVDGLGPALSPRYRPGVRALLVGPSGTGKTMAAGWLASRLGLPLYQVDLASINSKYIGETEKNLAQLLARAEHAEVILLFDEADSLFGKRTEIRDSNDRFANSQTNYLLQRIESFEGITLLTSNSRVRFDSAFTRRLDMILEFSAPGPEERRRVWIAHLGDGHRLSAAQLNQVAATFDLCGGHIRNAVLTASAMAAVARRTISLPDVLSGVEIEYRKLGRQAPACLPGTSPGGAS